MSDDALERALEENRRRSKAMSESPPAIGGLQPVRPPQVEHDGDGERGGEHRDAEPVEDAVDGLHEGGADHDE
jgi:hypothetical protein